MKNIIKEMNEGYLLVEASLDKLHKSIFTTKEDIEIIEHEFMELSIGFENLGISISELSENVM